MRDSSSGFAPLLGRLQRDVDAGIVPGAVVLVARGDTIELDEAVGFAHAAERVEMARHSVFRVASLSKPITAVAALMLVEEGLLDLGAPVRSYLPEFRAQKVGVEESGQLRLEAPRRPMSVQDLFRHTAGLTYGHFGSSAVKTLYQEAKPMDAGQTMAEMASKLANLPLASHPGTLWDYGMATDLLGHVVEVVSGQDFDRFLEQRIFTPLGMTDTNFHVRDDAVARVAHPLPPPAGSGRNSAFRPKMPLRRERPSWFSGGSGMVSTVPDYWRFANALRRGSKTPLLSPAMLRLMTADHLASGVAREPYITQMMSDLAPAVEFGQGFGLGVGVRTAPGLAPVPGSVGDFFWQGASGPYFWVDPVLDLTAICFLQVQPNQVDRYRRLFRTEVYAALS